MDQIWTFIGTMTWKDWVALVGAIVLPLGALNAFLGLRSRYKDWQGTRSKKKFEKRLREYEIQMYELADYHADPKEFFYDVLTNATKLATYFILSVFFFFLAFAFSIAPRRFGLDYFLSGVALGGLIRTIAEAVKLLTLIKRMKTPMWFVAHVQDFISMGLKKGYVKEEDKGLKSLYAEVERIPLKVEMEWLPRTSSSP